MRSVLLPMNPRAFSVLAITSAFAILIGCGGGGGGGSATATTATTASTSTSSTSSTAGGTGTVPTAKTKADANDAMVAFGQSIATNSFAGYGPKTHVGSNIQFDPILNLWFTVRFAPSGMQELLYGDQARTIPAGSLLYTIVDAAMTMNGDISVTQGPYAGLAGTYFISNANPGFNGSIAYVGPNGAQIVDQFVGTQNTDGTFDSLSTIGVTLTDGYGATQNFASHADGTMDVTATDTNSLTETLKFKTDYSGTGQITGKLPGLPATIQWDVTGNGSIKFADGSTITIVAWQLAA